MPDFTDQLALLRRKMAEAGKRCDQRYVAAASASEFDVAEQPGTIEDAVNGHVVENAKGSHFQTESLKANHLRHGSVEISDLAALPYDLLQAISGGEIGATHPQRWAFLDTETTGLAGGSGTYAFLIGIGSIDPDGFRVRQFFMRDHHEEPSQLEAVAEHLSRFDVLITYNGKSFDQPLLESRYTMSRARTPFARMTHLDLLYGSRRLWKLRLDDCRLVSLEQQILGVEREGDVPGSLIPHYYFEYVRSRRALRIAPVFEHNVMDIVTLACLTALVPQTFRDPANVRARHGTDLLGLGRWLLQADREAEALILLRRAVEIGMPDALLFRTLFEIACLEKKRENSDVAVGLFAEIAGCANAFRIRSLEELAKWEEHRKRNYLGALEWTAEAIRLAPSAELNVRRARLERKLDGCRSCAVNETLY